MNSRLLLRMVAIPTIISFVVVAAFAAGGAFLWAQVCKVVETLAPQYQEIARTDPSYLHNLLDRLQDSVTWVIAVSAAMALLGAVVWFISGWRARIDGPGVAFQKRWTWRGIASLTFIVFAGAAVAVAYQQGLNLKVASSAMIYEASALGIGFLLAFWLASLFATPAKLRPAVPLGSHMPIWLRW